MLSFITWSDYENILVTRYRAGGHTGETALQFAQEEIRAIMFGNHCTDGKPTPADPQRLILAQLSPDEREQFTERAAIMEYDAGMSRADAEALAMVGILNEKYPAPVAPEKSQPVYRSSDAIKHTVAAGIPIKEFFAKSKDNDSAAYTTDLEKITGWRNEGQRRFKAFIRGTFLAVDIDRKPGKVDGLEMFYKLFPRETLPTELQDISGGSFPCYTQTPSGGFHLFFKYAGPEVKLRELAPSIEIVEWQITAPGSVKENGEYVLHGELTEAPPLYGFLLDHIEKAKRRKEQEKAERAKPRTRAAADSPAQFTRPRITLDDLADESIAVHAGHHDRQVSFAGRAFRCKFSGAETLVYVKSRSDIFGNDADTENTILSVFRDNGGRP